MIIIDKEFIGMGSYGALFNVIKNGGFIKIGKHYGLNVIHHSGYIEVQTCAIGDEVNAKVMFQTMSNQFIKKPKPEVIEQVESTPEETKTEEEDLF